MKKVIFLSAAASLAMAAKLTPEQFRKYVQEGAIALRMDEADNSLYWVQNDNGRRYADDEADNSLYWVHNDNGRRYADDEQDNELYGGGDFGFGFRRDDAQDDELWGNYGGSVSFRRDDEQDDELWGNYGGSVGFRRDDEQDNELYGNSVNLGGYKRDDEVQDNNLIVNQIKDGYYTATNWALANPTKIYTIGNMVGNSLMNPTWDDELMFKKKTKKPVQQAEQTGESAQPTIPSHGHKNKKIGKKFRPIAQPEVQPELQVADNALFEYGLDDEFMLKKKTKKPVQQPEQTEESAQPIPHHGHKNKKGGKKFRPIAQPQVQPEVQVADNALFELGALLGDYEN